MEKQIEQLQKQLDKIIDNDLVHLKYDITEVKEKIGVISTNVSWLMKFFWVVMSASVGSFVTAVYGLILK